MPRPQFSIPTLLWLTLVVAAFLGGIGFERERRMRADYAFECEAWERQTKSIREAISAGRVTSLVSLPTHPFWKHFHPSQPADDSDF